MTQYATSEDLFSANQIETEDVNLINGLTVQVKGLSRFEYMLIGNNTDDANVIEGRLIRFGMINPKLDTDQIEHWQKNAPAGVISGVSNAIRRLSRIGEDAEKSDVS